MTFIPTVKRENLLQAYEFSEGSGSTVYDQSGNGYNGTITTATYNKNPSGQYGLDLGTNGFVNFGTTPFNVGTGDFTLIIWFKWNNDIGVILSKGIFEGVSSSYIGDWTIYPTSTNVNFRTIYSSSSPYYKDISISWSPVVGNWYMLTYTRISGTCYAYIDTTLGGSVSNTTSLNTTDNMYIGRDTTTSRYLDAFVKSFYSFNTGFSQEDVTAFYKQTFIQ